jgi:hypothetical protein
MRKTLDVKESKAPKQGNLAFWFLIGMMALAGILLMTKFLYG